MRRSGLPEGHSIAKVTAHGCDCHMRRLTSRIGGWSDGKETTEERAASRAGESKFLQARSFKSWRSNSVGTGIVGVQARRFPDRATAFSGQTPNFCWTSPQRGKEQRTKAPHPRKAQQSFSSFSCSFLLSITTSHNHKHRQYADLQGATLRLLERAAVIRATPIFLLLELESPLFLTAQPLPESSNT